MPGRLIARPGMFSAVSLYNFDPTGKEIGIFSPIKPEINDDIHSKFHLILKKNAFQIDIPFR
jgi:hypothetical protein